MGLRTRWDGLSWPAAELRRPRDANVDVDASRTLPQACAALAVCAERSHCDISDAVPLACTRKPSLACHVASVVHVCLCVCVRARANVRTAHSRVQRAACCRCCRCAQRSGAKWSRTARRPQATTRARATQSHGQSIDARRGETAAPAWRHGGRQGGGYIRYNGCEQGGGPPAEL